MGAKFIQNSNDSQDEATVMGHISDTYNGAIKQANEAPPAIVVLVGPNGTVGRQWLLTKEETTIGRSPDCDVYINDNSLSRSHAKIVLTHSGVSIVDLNSTNKTAINDFSLAPMTTNKLQNNSRIKTGNIIFRFLDKGNIEIITNQQLNDKAHKDALTGAYSKGALLEKGPELITRSVNLNEPLSLITFDLDFFKKINDNFGHLAGDYVLKELGRVLNDKLVRANDFLCRFGGEEFIILLQSTHLKTAVEVAERIRTTVESHQFIFDQKKVPVTISIGVSQLQQNEYWDSFYERADKALYQSKQNGRNRVTVAS